MQQRTLQQNRAMHLLFRQLADTLNESGLDMRKVLKPEVDIPWTPENVKEYLWRPIQRLQTNKDSTADLETKEVDEVFETIARHLSEKFGLVAHFPSIETIIAGIHRDVGR